MSMNGIVSTLQRRQGLDYKINFGVEIPRLKAIAQEYLKDKELATTLWHDNIRECKLLAIFLLPQEHYSELAKEWVTEAPFTEIADHLAMNILCKLPTATTDALEWLGCDKGLSKYCGYLTLTHIFRKGTTLTPSEEQAFFNHVTTLFAGCSDKLLTRIAVTALCKYIDLGSYSTEQIEALAKTNEQLAVMIKNYIGEEEL